LLLETFQEFVDMFGRDKNVLISTTGATLRTSCWAKLTLSSS
jgi:hypothetical protein